MRRKILAFILMAIATVGLSGASASAIALTSGQTQFYTVQFRDDNRAIVYAKMVFQNGSSTADRTTYSFELPDGVKVTSLTVQQILAKTASPKCLMYAEATEVADDSVKSSLPCLEYAESTYDEDFDYTNTSSSYSWYYDYYYNNYRYADHYDYVDLKPTLKDSTYTVTLDKAVVPHKQGAVLVSYVSDSYVSGQWFGRFSYDFKTLKSDEVIDKASVAINFDGGLYTRNVTQQRTTETSSSASDSVSGAAPDSSYQSKSMNNLMYSVGQGGMYTKTQNTMLPDDIMTVSGLYATNPVVLFSTEIGITILVLLIIGIGIWQGMRYYRRKQGSVKHVEKSVVNNNATKHDKVIEASSDSHFMTISFKRMAVVSAVSLVASVVITVLIAFMSSLMSNYYSIYYMTNMLGVIVVFVALVITLIGAPLLYVFKYGRRSALRWMLFHMGVIIVVFILIACIVRIFATDTPIYYPEYAI